MRYLRPLILQPESLKSKAQKTWINYVIRELQNYQITECRLKKDLSINNFSDLQASYEKNTIQITTLLDKNLPKVLQEELFDVGLYLIRYHSLFLFLLTSIENIFELFLRAQSFTSLTERSPSRVKT